MPANHIIQLPRNIKGHDYIIGDVHGCNAGLRAVIADLKVHDRLFLVGDLFDRGPDSVDVYNAIVEAKRMGKQVFATRGNHEDIFLKAMPVLRYFKNNPTSSVNTASKQAIYDLFRNGGSWVFSDIVDKDLFLEENLRNTALDAFVCDEAFFTKSLQIELENIQSYLESLPYIILVGDIDNKRNSFIVCHADMPFDDDVLRLRLATHALILQPAEIWHVTWERPDHPKLRTSSYPSGRHAGSLLTYCGHSILWKYLPFETRAVRAETNHVNLDVGAYLDVEMQMFLRMNHTTGKADVIIGKDLYCQSIEQCGNEHSLLLASKRIMQHIVVLRKIIDQKERNSSCAELIARIQEELSKLLTSNMGSDSNLEMLELQLSLREPSNFASPLIPQGKQSSNRAKKLELAGMIRELQRLNSDCMAPSTWQPSELSTQKETCCCFFSRYTMFNQFYDQVVQLGGEPSVFAPETHSPFSK